MVICLKRDHGNKIYGHLCLYLPYYKYMNIYTESINLVQNITPFVPKLQRFCNWVRHSCFFAKKKSSKLSNGLAIDFDKFGNLTNRGSNCAYMQKSVRLGIGVFARWRDSSRAGILLRHTYSFSHVPPSEFSHDCSVVPPSLLLRGVAIFRRSSSCWLGGVSSNPESIGVVPAS